jgi:hypothetical protein
LQFPLLGCSSELPDLADAAYADFPSYSAVQRWVRRTVGSSPLLGGDRSIVRCHAEGPSAQPRQQLVFPFHRLDAHQQQAASCRLHPCEQPLLYAALPSTFSPSFCASVSGLCWYEPRCGQPLLCAGLPSAFSPSFCASVSGLCWYEPFLAFRCCGFEHEQ